MVTKSGSGPASRRNRRTGNPQILIADDDRLILATVGNGLRGAGYDVLEAADGEQTLALCMEKQPDLALLDVRMPKLTGIEVARRLRAQSIRDVPVMFLSAYGESELVGQAVSEGALGYLLKPLDVDQIVPAIAAGLARAEEFRQLSTALKTGRETATAVGLLMERYGLSNADAFEMLRRWARSEQSKLPDAASALLQAAETLSSPGSRHGG